MPSTAFLALSKDLNSMCPYFPKTQQALAYNIPMGESNSGRTCYSRMTSILSLRSLLANISSFRTPKAHKRASFFNREIGSLVLGSSYYLIHK